MDHTMTLTPRIQAYVREVGTREHPALAACREATHALGDIAIMQVSPEQGAFLGLIVQMLNAKRVLEIGTFTGYSTMAMALAMPEGGQIITCDRSEEYLAMAQSHWNAGRVAEKIEKRVGPARESLDTLITEASGSPPFDFAFIDADKTQYDAYYERCVTLLRRGGIVALDNMLQMGRVADPDDRSDAVEAIRELNAKISGDTRVDMVLLPIGDGVTLCRKR